MMVKNTPIHVGFVVSEIADSKNTKTIDYKTRSEG